MTKIGMFFEIEKVFAMVFRLPFLVQTIVTAYIQGYWIFLTIFMAGQRFEISQVQTQNYAGWSHFNNGLVETNELR